MKTKVVGLIMFLLLTAWFSCTVYAEKLNLCANDWPVNEFLRGMNTLGQLNEFNLNHDKFSTPESITGNAARLFGREPLNTDTWFDDSLLQELVKEQL